MKRCLPITWGLYVSRCWSSWSCAHASDAAQYGPSMSMSQHRARCMSCQSHTRSSSRSRSASTNKLFMSPAATGIGRSTCPSPTRSGTLGRLPSHGYLAACNAGSCTRRRAVRVDLLGTNLGGTSSRPPMPITVRSVRPRSGSRPGWRNQRVCGRSPRSGSRCCPSPPGWLPVRCVRSPGTGTRCGRRR